MGRRVAVGKSAGGGGGGVTDHGGLTGLEDDDHNQYIKHSLATAANDFLLASGVGVFVKKTLAEVKTALGLGGAAYLGVGTIAGTVAAGDDSRLASAYSHISLTTNPHLFPNPNLVINGGFNVNQRVYVSGATLATGKFGHDRWKAGAGGGDYSFTQLVGGPTTITIAADKSLIQVIENENVQGGSYIVSWLGSSTARIGLNSAIPSGSYDVSPVLISGQTAGAAMSVEFGPGTLGQIKIEAGTVATPFATKLYGEELGDCQRHCQVIGSTTSPGAYIAGSVVVTAIDIRFVVHLPTTMRAAPSLSVVGIRGADWYLIDKDGNANATGGLLILSRATPVSVVEFYFGPGTYAANTSHAIQCNAGAKFVLSSDL